VVTASRTGNAVDYRLAHPKIAELLAIARVFLVDTLARSQDQLAAARRLSEPDSTERQA
jgi:glycerol-3-phosphate responsive antiterminator